MGLSEVYAEETHDHLLPYYANWEPGEPVQLGDYGRMDGDIFIREGNINTFGITFKTRKDKTRDQKKFSSEGTTETEVGAGASGDVGAATVKAGLQINFSRKNSVFFNAADCITESIEDRTAVGNRLMELYEQDTWKKKWAVITDIVKAGATTVAISLDSNASVTFEATGNVKKIDLADAKIGLKIGSSSKVGYTLEAAKGMIPLFKLFKIQSVGLFGIFGPTEFAPAMAVKPGKKSKKGKEVSVEKGKAKIVFGEL